MEKPSLRVSGHGGSLNRTFIVEDCSEGDIGQWTPDEITGEQAYVDHKKSCFWTSDDNEYAWQSRPFKSRQLKRREGKGKENGQRKIQKDQKSIFLAKNKHKVLNCGKKKTLLGGPKEGKTRRAGRRATMAF